MKHLKTILYIALFVSLIFTFNSCSMGREDEAPLDQGRSQVELLVGTEGDSFESNMDYEIEIDSGYIVINDVIISGSAARSAARAYELGFCCLDGNCQSRHPEDTAEFDTALELDGPFVVDITRELTHLGFHTANPGEFTSLFFEVHPEDEDAEPMEPAIRVQGTASKDGHTYTFHLVLPLAGEDEIEFLVEDLDIDLDIGHYTTATIFFETDEWFDYVDFSDADVEDGVIHISPTQNSEIADLIVENIKEHFFIEVRGRLE